MTQLTYREAAKHVKRSVRTIKRWHRDGMPMGWSDGLRVVDEKVLQEHARARMKAWPAWQHHLRRLRDGAPHGSRRRYDDGCHCDECRAAEATRRKTHRRV